MQIEASSATAATPRTMSDDPWARKTALQVGDGEGGPWLHDCIDGYKRAAQRRFEVNEIGEDHAFTILQHADTAKSAMPNVRINTLTLDGLTEIRQHWTRRPANKSTGRPIAVSTVRHLVRTTKALFQYCLRREGWRPSLFWEDAFATVNVKKLRTPGEKKQAAQGQPHFSVPKLQLCWPIGPQFERLVMGLGLWCGFTAKEIATLRKDDIVAKGDEVWIDRLRQKTDVAGRWWLPPELAKLLVAATSGTPDKPQQLALLGSGGRPLVHRGDSSRKHKTDCVADAWNRVRYRKGLETISNN